LICKLYFLTVPYSRILPAFMKSSCPDFIGFIFHLHFYARIVYSITYAEMAFLFKGGMIATGFPLFVGRADVLVDGNRIAAVGSDIAARRPGTELVDCSNFLITPGFINGHIHLSQLLNRGFLDGLGTETLLRSMHSRHNAKTDQDRYWASLVSIYEGLRSGTTTYCAFATSLGHIGQAMVDAGVRGTVTVAKKDQWWGEGIPEKYETAQILGGLQDTIEKWNSDRVSISIGAASDRAASESLLRGLMDLAAQQRVRIMIHVGEGMESVNLSLQHRNQHPVEFLADIGFLSPSVTLIHASNILQAEVELIAQHGATVCHCPISNAKTAAGTMPLRRFWDAGIPVALGTDAASTGNTNNLLVEAYFAGLIQMAVSGDCAFPDTAHLFSLLTTQGAKAIGLSDLIGEIKPSYRADLVLWDLSQSAFLPNLCNPVGALIYCGSEIRASRVFVDGTEVYSNTPLCFDLKRALAELRRYSNQVSHC
jgi:5-methylthioadenosine/S-adenosylhomocysteine deaminase